MVLLHLKIVVVLLWFQKRNVTAQDPGDLTAQGIHERIFTASTLKNLWVFQAACQSLFSGNALEKFNRHSSLPSLVSLFRSISFSEDYVGPTPPSEKEQEMSQISMHENTSVKTGTLFQGRKWDSVQQLLSAQSQLLPSQRYFLLHNLH